MYEMVTGRRPFLGDSDYSIMSAHFAADAGRAHRNHSRRAGDFERSHPDGDRKRPCGAIPVGGGVPRRARNGISQAAATETMDVVILPIPPPVSQMPPAIPPRFQLYLPQGPTAAGTLHGHGRTGHVVVLAAPWLKVRS